MGSSGSKVERNIQKLDCKHAKGKSKLCTMKNEASVLNSFEEQKSEFEQQYKKLQEDHQKLQTEFLELKAKYDQDFMNGGDFASHADEINKLIEDALHERETLPLQSLEDPSEGSNCTQEGHVDLVALELEGTKARILSLQEELDKLLAVNVDKEHEIEELKKEMEIVKLKDQEERARLKEEFTTKGLLLCERYEEEKKELNSIWEEKLAEVINNCNQDISSFRAKLNREKSALEEKLELAITELVALEKKNKLLTNLFEDIRRRYDSRESRTEDLERIADLEGQLILQAEELEKQKEILKNIKLSSSNGSGSTNGTGRRSKKNAKKRRKQNFENQDSVGSSLS